MASTSIYSLAADLTLFIHVLLVACVVFGLVLIFAGKLLAWSWVRNPWFRLFHLIVITTVVLQSWFGLLCPLTILENALRAKAGEAGYAESFMADWLERILYYNAPAWVFTLAYTLFGLLVAASWFWVRPRPFRRSRGTIK